MKRFFTLLGLVCFLSIATQSDVIAQAKHAFSYHIIFPNYVTPDNANRKFDENWSEVNGRGVSLAYQRHLGSDFYLSFPLKYMSTSTTLLPNGRTSGRSDLGSIDVLVQKYLGKSSNMFRPYVNLGPSFQRNFTQDMNDFNFPAGLGLNIRLVEGIYFDAYSQYRLSTQDNDGWNHGLGFNIMFGGDKDVNPPPTPVLPSDKDGDGIIDTADACPEEAGPASTQGCPDADGDGIADKDDKCPDIAGVARFSGCKDTDGDGIADPEDGCPEKAGPASNKGCPISDRDGDGVIDTEDKCPEQAGPASNAGCPLADRDGDGVADADDACPDVKGLAKYKGCPDTDGDGVPDNIDKCKDKAGPASNQGCPEMKVEDKAKLANAVRNVQFNTGSNVLTANSNTVLNEVSDLMARYPEYNMTISGYTDSSGDAILNKNLSERRAKACYDYLIKRGVAASRMSSAGYGEEQPIADNGTAAGRALNRRVVFNMFVR